MLGRLVCPMWCCQDILFRTTRWSKYVENRMLKIKQAAEFFKCKEDELWRINNGYCKLS